MKLPLFNEWGIYFYMKYIITETQYDSLKNGVPTWVIRRANHEHLSTYIRWGELEYPNPCDDYEDPYDWADEVIDYAIDKMLSAQVEDIENHDNYSNIMDFLRMTCRNLFGEYLIKIYEDICSE